MRMFSFFVEAPIHFPNGLKALDKTREIFFCFCTEKDGDSNDRESARKTAGCAHHQK